MKGWRTLAFNAAGALLGVAATFDWTGALHNPTAAGAIVTGITVGNMVLRSLTNTPVGQSQ